MLIFVAWGEDKRINITLNCVRIFYSVSKSSIHISMLIRTVVRELKVMNLRPTWTQNFKHHKMTDMPI